MSSLVLGKTSSEISVFTCTVLDDLSFLCLMELLKFSLITGLSSYSKSFFDGLFCGI